MMGMLTFTLLQKENKEIIDCEKLIWVDGCMILLLKLF